MPFIPHTSQDIRDMLATIRVNQIEDLFDEIPSTLRHASLDDIPSGTTEMHLNKLMRARAALDGPFLCFIGAGAYEHHIPAAVWEIATRGEFMTAYTPYQPEASQGSLQLIYEFQTMMASLMGLEVSNASLYDGASALGESILMAVRLSKHHKNRILIPRNVHPYYRKTVKAIIAAQNIEMEEIAYDPETGKIDLKALDAAYNEKVAAIVLPQPNFFGVLEDVDQLTGWAHAKNCLVIGLVNPMSMGLLKPPGQWGSSGVDIACGEGQSLGVPLASGGPYYGFLCTKRSYVRQMPGRIVGKTEDKEGKPGYVLTLQAREQHIRRAKANSNICTNQGLMVVASTIYMSLMGPQGLKAVSASAHQRTRELVAALKTLAQVKVVFAGPYFHEVVVSFEQPVKGILEKLAKRGIQGGFALVADYPELGQSLLICVTETKTKEDVALLVENLREILAC